MKQKLGQLAVAALIGFALLMIHAPSVSGSGCGSMAYNPRTSRFDCIGSATASSAQGGTGADLSAAPAHSTIISNGATPAVYSAKVIPDCVDTGGNHLNFTQSTDAFSCGTSGGGGSANQITYAGSVSAAQLNLNQVLVAGSAGHTLTVNHFMVMPVGGQVAGCTLIKLTDTDASPVTIAQIAAGGAGDGENLIAGWGIDETANVLQVQGLNGVLTLGAFVTSSLTADKGIQIVKTGADCTGATSFRVVIGYTST